MSTTLFKVTGKYTACCYYGYTQNDDVRQAFLGGAERCEQIRKDVQFLTDNGSDPQDLSFETIEVFEDEIDAHIARNDLRASDPMSYTGPTNWPLQTHRKATEKHPEKEHLWNVSNKIRTMPAVVGYKKHNVFKFADIKKLGQDHGNQQVLTSLSQMTVTQFAQHFCVEMDLSMVA